MMMRRLLFAVALLLPFSVIRPQAPVGPGARDYDAGRAYLRTGQADRAERSFERAVEKEPRNGLYHLWLGNAVGMQAANASVVRQPFMARRIKSEFERAVQLDPELLDARDGLITFYLMAPAVMGGDAAKAREQQREIARRDPVRGHIAAANIAWRARDTVATERSLRAASAAAPDSLAPASALAGRLLNWKRNAAAFSVWDTFLARHPQSITGRYQFARIAAVTGERLPDGERYLRAILAIEEWPENNWTPGKAAAYSRLGDILRHQRRRDESRAAYERALALDANLQVAKVGLKALGSTN
jgi:tetratricopeptide (TPR) repeat protein